MNISGNNWLVNGAEKSYQNFRPQIDFNPGSKTGSTTSNAKNATQSAFKISEPKDILSGRELETLQALFSGVKVEKSFYGSAKVKSVQAGFLLDIKG